jgi:regulator of protease activity HflC (stomatin/prohibitin superfamily)
VNAWMDSAVTRAMKIRMNARRDPVAMAQRARNQARGVTSMLGITCAFARAGGEGWSVMRT